MDTRTLTNPYLEKTLDLGPIDAPVLICGGAYSNLEALTALFEESDSLGFDSNRIIHTGDVVAYCADPAATSHLLRERGVHCIQGNMEESLGIGMSDCGCGFEEGSPCEQLSAAWFSYVDRETDDDLRRWMGHMPCQLTFSMSDMRARVVHGGVREINAFIFTSTPDEAISAEFSACDADIIIGGHCGLPFTRGPLACGMDAERIAPRIWHNPGPLGMPANDGTPRVWYSIITPENGAVRFEHHALDYDHESAHRKMIEAGLPEGYAQALITGLWPNLDILPAAERTMTGRKLTLENARISAPPAPSKV